MKVAIDAGHGKKLGVYTGARGSGLIEDVVAFQIATRLGHYLRALGVQTACTRPNRWVPLDQRATDARRQECDLFLSIHLNSGPSTAHGAEAFVHDGDTRSAAIARKLLEAVTKCGFASREVKPQSQSHVRRLAVLEGTYRKMPAVLLEVGFLSNPRDAGLLADKRVREKLAERLAAAICGWWR